MHMHGMNEIITAADKRQSQCLTQLHCGPHLSQAMLSIDYEIVGKAPTVPQMEFNG